MGRIPATVGILTFNSAATLERALESVKDFAEIVVCDGGSTDETLEIARKYGAKIIEQSSQFKDENNRLIDFSGVRNQSLEAATYDWFFYIDSDESCSEGLHEEIRKVVVTDDPDDIYRIPTRIWIGDREILHSSNYPGYQTRLFNKKIGN